MSTQPLTDAEIEPDEISKEGRLVVGLLLVSAFVVILNETLMGVALPELMTQLSVTASTAQWLTTGFLLTMAVIIPVTGFLIQRFPLRGLFLTAMSLFSLGTLLAAIAPEFGVLMLGRVVQASGTAIMMPLLMTTVLNVVPASRRGRMMGMIAIVISVAPAIGPSVSGLILDVLDWRWMFWFVLPIALLSLTLGAIWVRNVVAPRKVAVDVLSIILSAFAFGGLIFGLASIGEATEGNAMLPPWIPLTVGAATLAAFVSRQIVLQRSDRALLDLRTFAVPTFSIAIVLVVVSMMALFGTLIVLPIYLQTVLGHSTLTTGLMLLPGGLLMGLIAPFVGRIFDRVGPRPLVIPGAIIVSIVLWSMTLLDENSGIGLIIGMHVALGFGLGLTFTPLLTSALGSLAPHLYPHGSAIVGTVQQLAGAAGTALFITLMSTQAVARAAEGATATMATAGGVHAAFLCGAIISVLAVIAAFFIRRPADSLPGEPAVAH